MPRRKDNSPAISFFSFQDIITSVTGIMFLVVLILILMLLMRKSPDPAEQAEISQTKALQEELSALQQNLAALEESSKQEEKRLEELSRMNPEEIPGRLASLNAMLRALEARNREAREKLAESRTLLEAVREDNATLKKSVGDMRTEVREKTTEARELSEKVVELRKKAKNVKRTMRFTWNRHSSKTPYLVECGGSAISLGISEEENARFTVTSDGQEPTELVARFLDKIEGFDKAGCYFLLLVKPSAFVYAEELSGLLRRKGFERGREILPGDDVEVFKQRSVSR